MDTKHDFESVYREQSARMYQALVGYSGDREIAREAVAEAFARGLSSAASIRDPALWVWRVAFRVAGEELKHRGRFSPPGDAEQPAPEPPELVEALARLSPRQRAALILHYYAGYSLDEIAAILGTKKGTIGVHLHRGRTRLRHLLEVDDG